MLSIDLTDDQLLRIYPLPEHIDLDTLPWNLPQGPGGTWDPYKQPLNDVDFSDPNEVHVVGTFPAIPEFSMVILPAVEMTVVGVTTSGLRRNRS